MGDFFYPDQYIYDTEIFEPEMAGSLGMFAVIYMGLMLLAAAISMVCYVLESLGLYTIAGRRGIKNNWLAWVPFGNLWILGSISDQYQYLTKNKIKNRRKVMLGLSIAVIFLIIVWVVGMLSSAVLGNMGQIVLRYFLGFFALLVVAILLTVMQYIAYYDLYSSCQPNNAALYLVLSILFPITLPFFVFFCRKKDLGMPPRKQPAPQPVIEPVEVETVPEEESEETPEGYAAPEEFEDE